MTGSIHHEQPLGAWGDLALFRALSGELQLSGLAVTFPDSEPTSYTTLAIDRVYLEFEVVASVPEPEMLGMILAGLGMLAFSTRRRIAAD